jgi:hypothetical protein
VTARSSRAVQIHYNHLLHEQRGNSRKFHQYVAVLLSSPKAINFVRLCAYRCE